MSHHHEDHPLGTPFWRREDRESCGLSILELHNWTLIPVPHLEDIDSGEAVPSAGEALLIRSRSRR